jgi:hypothetical protein
MKILALLLIFVAALPGCCWNCPIPRCNTCTSSKDRTTKPLDYSYDDTRYNDEINI